MSKTSYKERRLSDKMKHEAVTLGLCAQWTAEWQDGTSKDDMVEKFVEGIDLCIQHNWPSVEVMKKSFGDVIHRHGVYVDESTSLLNPSTAIFNGHCDASVTCCDYAVSNIYVRHKSKVRITAGDQSYVRVNLYDDSEATIHCEGSARCFVYHYGGRLTSEGRVTVRERIKE